MDKTTNEGVRSSLLDIIASDSDIDKLEHVYKNAELKVICDNLSLTQKDDGFPYSILVDTNGEYMSSPSYAGSAIRRSLTSKIRGDLDYIRNGSYRKLFENFSLTGYVTTLVAEYPQHHYSNVYMTISSHGVLTVYYTKTIECDLSDGSMKYLKSISSDLHHLAPPCSFWGAVL